MEVEGVCRRLFGPRRRASSDIRNYMTERMVLDRSTQDRDRERERQHVRGEAHPLLNLKTADDEDPSMISQQQCSTVSFVCIFLSFVVDVLVGCSLLIIARVVICVEPYRPSGRNTWYRVILDVKIFMGADVFLVSQNDFCLYYNYRRD